MNFTMVHYKWGERNAGRTQEEWLAAYDEANRKLRIAADELLLLEASVERCVNELLDGLSLGSAPDKILAASRPGGQFDVERNALRNQLRHVLKG